MFKSWTKNSNPTLILIRTPPTISNKMPRNLLLSCICFLTLFPTITGAQLILSEAMGDPSQVTDTKGEYFELSNIGFTTIIENNLKIVVNDDTLRLGAVKLERQAYFLICVDSNYLENGGLLCNREWKNFSFPNSRNTELHLWGKDSTNYVLPSPQGGKSWENKNERENNYSTFKLSTMHFGLDYGTPGGINSQALISPLVDSLPNSSPSHFSVSSPSWEISSRILDIEATDKPLTISINADVTQVFSLQVFDLSGNNLFNLCVTCQGSQVFSWMGEDASNNILPVGPYILGFKIKGHALHKKTIVLAKSRS